MSMNSDNPRRYNWETWPGKNIPLCQGRCLFGPDLGVWICNITIIIVCSILFYIFVGNRIHPATIVVGVFLDILTLICLMYATFTEPGIIPRAYHEAGQPRPPPQTQLVNGVHIPLKYCDTCHIYRPPRAKHCRDCDCCIEEFDHHCPWVCNCVGRRNYRFFVAFVCSVCILDIYVFFLSGYLIIRETMSSTFSESVSSNPIAAALTAITLMLGCCLGSLAGYHCSLIAEQMTTNEHIKRSRAHDHEDESQDIQQQHISFIDALKRTCCTPIPQSRIDLRGLSIPITVGALSSTLHESSIHTTIPPTSQATSAPIALPLDDDIHETSRDRMVHDVHDGHDGHEIV